MASPSPTRAPSAARLRTPVWANLDAANLARFPVLAGVEALTIFTDRDASGTGQRAALECAERWLDAGREVQIVAADEIGTDAIFDGKTYNLTGCTETFNASACNVRSNKGTNTVINPVKSARISTVDSVSIVYGKVEVKAKMPRGDWLWPAIWMLPKDEKYGEWPKSGEIDVSPYIRADRDEVIDFLLCLDC